MKHEKRLTKKVILAFLIFSFTLSFYVCKSNEQVEPTTKILFVKTKVGLKLREFPSQDSKVLKLLPFNSTVFILEKSKDEVVIDSKSGKWVKIRYQSFEGWVFDAFLTENKHEEDYLFLNTYIEKEINGFIVDYNQSFLQKLYKKETNNDEDYNKPIKINYNSFTIKPSIELNEKVKIVTPDNKIISDTVKSFYLVKPDFDCILFFILDKNSKAKGICFKESYILKNNILLSFPQEQSIESSIKSKIIIESTKYLADNNLKDSLQINPDDNEAIDLTNLKQYIIDNFNIEVKNYIVKNDIYTFTTFVHLKVDLEFLNAMVIMKNSHIIFAQNSKKEIFFLINNKPYILITIWKPYAGAIGQPLAEITDKGLEYKYYN